MAETPREAIRVWLVVQVEVTDPAGVAAYNLNWTRDAQGEPMMEVQSLPRDVQQAVATSITQHLAEVGPSRGFRLEGTSCPQEPEVFEYPPES